MSGPYETYESRTRRHTAGRSALGYWIPLALTITAASIGLAAWIWSERQDHEDGDDEDERRVQGSQKREDHDRYARTQGETGPRPPPSYGADVRTDASFANRTEPSVPEDGSAGMMARMSGVIRRTPSPQQLYDEASRRVAAGVAAAGAAVGGALSSIREESKDDYRDHSRWSEEAEMRANQGNARGKNTSQPLSDPRAGTTTLPGASMLSGKHQSNFKRKTVVIIVSADAHEAIHGAGTDDLHEDASILSHLPAHIDHARTRLFVLIYAPELKNHPLSTTSSIKPAGSVTSSFSNIAHEEALTPGEETEKPLESIDPEPIGVSRPGSGPLPALKLTGSESSSFRALYTHAQALVETDAMILPFTTSSGHVHMLRHLAPETVYVQESLSGNDGDAVTHISGWVGQVVVVVGAEGGHGGLVDSDDEAAHETVESERWWQRGDRVGLGKGIDVVDGMRIGEDWKRRVGGLE